MVTHEQALAEKYAKRMLHLADGRLVHDVANPGVANHAVAEHDLASGDPLDGAVPGEPRMNSPAQPRAMPGETP
jgi:energy-coupling factor transporter ATP-binding protein EcfA2